MKAELIFVPLIAHIFLVFSLYVLLLVRKKKAAKAGNVDLKATALNCKAWPEDVLKTSNNLDNQFEAPVLFYALCVVLYAVDGVCNLSLILAWFFTLSRVVHAYVHNTSNYVPVRMKVFALGLLSLLGMAGIALWKFAPFISENPSPALF